MEYLIRLSETIQWHTPPRSIGVFFFCTLARRSSVDAITCYHRFNCQGRNLRGKQAARRAARGQIKVSDWQGHLGVRARFLRCEVSAANSNAARTKLFHVHGVNAQIQRGTQCEGFCGGRLKCVLPVGNFLDYLLKPMILLD
jgi:hypothetical protein